MHLHLFKILLFLPRLFYLQLYCLVFCIIYIYIYVRVLCSDLNEHVRLFA